MNYTEITDKLALELLPDRPTDSNKGTFGKVLNIAGSAYYQGAAYFSSLAPLKVGAGLVTLASVPKVIDNIAGNCPWVTLLPLDTDYTGMHISPKAIRQLKPFLSTFRVISIGSGLSNNSDIVNFIKKFLKLVVSNKVPTILDADALNAIAVSNITELSQNMVITPHPLELSRLLGVNVEEVQSERIRYALIAAEKYGCNVVLKGHQTIVCSSDLSVFVNTTGNSSLAKAGSGDVLTGMISGFVAQGLTVLQASILSVYLHGLCGEIASKVLSEYSVLSTDLLDSIPLAIQILLQK